MMKSRLNNKKRNYGNRTNFYTNLNLEDDLGVEFAA